MYILSSLSSSRPACKIDLNYKIQTWYGHNQHDVYSVQWPAPCRWLLGGWQWADSDQSAYCCSWISWYESPVTSSLCMNVNRLVFSALTLTQTLQAFLQACSNAVDCQQYCNLWKWLILVTLSTKKRKKQAKSLNCISWAFKVLSETRPGMVWVNEMRKSELCRKS